MANKTNTQATQGYAPNHTTVPALINKPLIFVAPAELTVAGGEIWIAVSNSDPNYGGCYVYASNDNTSYKKIGKLDGNAKQGVLTSALSSVSPPFAVQDSLTLKLNNPTDDLESVSQQTFTNKDSLCYVGGEFLVYKTATLTAPSSYTLSTLTRGLYKRPTGADLNADFCLLDNAIFKKSFPAHKVGTTLYFKFQCFNLVGKGLQDLADLYAYSFLVTDNGGINALLADLPYRGTFTSLSTLTATLPTAKPGDYAQVNSGNGVQNYFWDHRAREWLNLAVTSALSAASVQQYALNAEADTYPTLISNLQLSAGIYQVLGYLGTSAALGSITIALRTQDSTLSTLTSSALGYHWQTANTLLSLSQSTDIDIIIWGENARLSTLIFDAQSSLTPASSSTILNTNSDITLNTDQQFLPLSSLQLINTALAPVLNNQLRLPSIPSSDLLLGRMSILKDSGETEEYNDISLHLVEGIAYARLNEADAITGMGSVSYLIYG
jgi:hypothetical protein